MPPTTRFAAVELERFAEFEGQRHEGVRQDALALAAPPLALGAMCVVLERLREHLVVERQLGRPPRTFVLRGDLHRLAQP